MTAEIRTLVVMRHAKAEAFPGVDGEDHERRLTDRGHRDARSTGEYLLANAVLPEHALVSTAARTRETWADVAAVLESEATEEFNRSLYGADPDTVLEQLREVDEDLETLIFIGHNPTVEMLSEALVDESPLSEAGRQMMAGFPTSGLAVFEVTDDWADLDFGGGRLTHFYVGRG